MFLWLLANVIWILGIVIPVKEGRPTESSPIVASVTLISSIWAKNSPFWGFASRCENLIRAAPRTSFVIPRRAFLITLGSALWSVVLFPSFFCYINLQIYSFYKWI